MTNNFLSNAPYHDDYDPSKGYTTLAALPGRVEQAREFTQLQTMFLDFLKRLGHTIHKNGSLVEGCGITLRQGSAIISKGKVYYDGIVFDTPESTVTITGRGKEVVGVTRKDEVVTEIEDPSLRDPAQGFDNYNQAGSHRIKSTLKFVVDDPTASPIYTIQDGQILNQEDRPQLDVITDLLARRTYDESGNYRVQGLDLWVEPRDLDTITLNVESGKAYVTGYEVVKPTSSKITIPKALLTRQINTEPKTYINGTNTYKLNNKPVKAITRIKAAVEVTQNITRGSVAGGIDYLPNSPVVSVVSVSQGGTTYAQGPDFQLTGDGIDWLPSGIEPSIGSTYTVVYRYHKFMTPGNDFLLSTTGQGDNKDYYVDFSPSGDNPVNNSTFDVDYEFYLSRKDLVGIDKYGNIRVFQGQPEVPRLVSTPINTNPDVLNLGSIYLPPNSSNAVANSYAITRQNMEDLQNLLKRVEDSEYNQALEALDKEALDREGPTNLKGIFSDGFIGVTKADLTHPDFSAAFSFEDGEIRLPVTQAKPNDFKISDTSKIKTWGRLVTAPVTEEVTIDQPYATGTMLVNPYNVFNRLALLNLSPAVDNWVDYSKVTIENTDTATYQVHRWWYHGGTLWNDTERYLFENLQLDKGQAWDGWDNKTGTITKSTSKVILDEAIQFIREREVEFTATNLIPMSDNLKVYFDGRQVEATPLPGFSKGSEAGTVRSDSEGKVKGKFTTPQGVRTGTREVSIKNDNNTAIASYTALGRKKVEQETVTRTRVTVEPYDPLAQSFMFDREKVLSSVGLYFAAKDNDHNVIIQVRNMVNGYPGQVIYGESVVTPDKVNVSANGTVETRVYFEDPIHCKAMQQFCVVVITDSDKYSMFIAELGKEDLVSKGILTRQPYLAGTLFSSANALTWTAHQTQDMKFRIYTCKFEDKGIIEFEPITNLGADRVVLMADYLTPENTGCTWEMKINDGPYQPISNYEDKELNSIATTLQLRATFVSSKDISPLLARDSFTLIGFLTATQGNYISKNVTLTQPYKNVKIVIEAHTPSGCTVVPKFSYDNGVTWVVPSLASTSPIDTNFTQFTYQSTISQENIKDYRVKVEMTSPNQIVRPRARKLMNIMK
ncbi:tail protein [Bacillus phage vB_BceM-HSE3]|nr:tail protein [Bacillus phage vB_BceM-HSE3]